MYKQTINILGGEPTTEISKTEGAAIPFDPANTDYQAYLKWVAEGNEQIPAEE